MLGSCLLGAQCSLVSTTSKSAKAGRVHNGQTLYLSRSADLAAKVSAITESRLEQPQMTTDDSTPPPPSSSPIEKSITTRKSLLYEQPEGEGRLLVKFDGGELELGLSSLVAYVGKSESSLTRQLKMASMDGKTVVTRFVGARDGEACVMSSIKVESGGFSTVKEGLYYTIWDFLDSEGGLAACRTEEGSVKPTVDIAKFKRRYPNDVGLYDDGQALLVDGKVVAARIIGHACRE